MKREHSCIAFTYVLLSLVFIIINIVTLNNLTPWIDEVMMLDTSYNMAVHGSWETTAWYRVAGQYPFSTYPPLYQMLAAVWIWLFGGSLTVVRSINLLVTFILGGIWLRLITRHGRTVTHWTAGLFALLLWGSSEMAWMYRNGRPDMLCALVFVLTMQATDCYLMKNTMATRCAVIVTAALLICSGVQAAVCLCACWLFFFLVIKGRRMEALRLLVLLLTGMLLGLLLVMLFMLAHGRLTAFASSIIQYSATLSGFALTVLPWAGEMFGFSSAPYTQKLLELSTESSFLERLASVTAYRSFLILTAVALAAYITCFRKNPSLLLSDKGFLALLFTLCVPVVMNLAGRFPAYYWWMVCIPMVTSIMSIAARHRLWLAVFGMTAVLLTVFGIRSMLYDKPSSAGKHPCKMGSGYENLRSFVQRQHFKQSDAVVCPFSTFYELKPICDTCYFAGIFPMEFMGHVDYILEAPDGDGFDQPISDYVNKLKADPAIVLTVIDRCEHPSLTLYQVQTKHE